MSTSSTSRGRRRSGPPPRSSGRTGTSPTTSTCSPLRRSSRTTTSPTTTGTSGTTPTNTSATRAWSGTSTSPRASAIRPTPTSPSHSRSATAGPMSGTAGGCRRRCSNQVLHEPYRELYLRRVRTLADEWFGTGRYEALARATFAGIAPEWVLDTNTWGFWGGQAFSQSERHRPARRRMDRPVLRPPERRSRRRHPRATTGRSRSRALRRRRTERPRAEHIRIRNNEDVAIDISGWTLTGSATAILPPGSVLPAQRVGPRRGRRPAGGLPPPRPTSTCWASTTQPLADAGGAVDLVDLGDAVRASAAGDPALPRPG